MDTRPNELKTLFEYINKRGINATTVDKKIEKLNSTVAIGLYDEIFEDIPYTLPLLHRKLPQKDRTALFSPFDFITSPVLSGGGFPCGAIDCSLKAADELARFAALYAEHALIRFPMRDMRYDLRRYGIDLLRGHVLHDLEMLFYYRPLLEEGIIGIMPDRSLLCEECQKAAIEELNSMEKTVREIAEANFDKFEVYYSVAEESHQLEVVFFGPEEFVGSHPSTFLLHGKEFEEKYYGEDDLFWVTEFIREGVSGVIQPYWNKGSYLTNYTPDISLLKKITKKKSPETHTSVLEGFSHNLPFIRDVSISSLIELRNKEGEAFQVYRDALRLALKSVGDAEKESSQVFDDIVLPELNKIDNTIKNSKKIVTRSLSQDLLIGAGFIALGLSVGLVSPTFGACLSALGGSKFVSGLVKDAAHVLSEPLEIRNNSYYFLWKVRKRARKNARK